MPRPNSDGVPVTQLRTLLTLIAAAIAGPAVAADVSVFGSGYTAADAPLGAPTELRIDLKGRVPARCEVVTPPAAMDNLALTRAGEDEAGFAIDCNAPFILRVRSDKGGFASVDPTPGIETLMPYQLAVAVGTDAGHQNLGWCDAAALTDAGAAGCAFSPAAASQGWSSGEATAINQTGALRLRWDQTASGTPLLGRYRDTIVIELEVRS